MYIRKEKRMGNEELDKYTLENRKGNSLRETK
jgi:hypothetical protein